MAELSSFHRKRYGEWAGNEAGVKANPENCCERTFSDHRFSQCSNKRGHGPEEAYCWTHSPAVVQSRRDKSEKAYRDNKEKHRIQRAGAPLLEVVKKIAEGHNDAMGLAQETLTKLNLW